MTDDLPDRPDTVGDEDDVSPREVDVIRLGPGDEDGADTAPAFDEAGDLDDPERSDLTDDARPAIDDYRD